MDIDTRSIPEILKIINEEDKRVASAVENEIAYIAKAVEIVVDSFKKGGRLIYIGAGTSGRLGVLDAVECPPTFGVRPEIVRGIIAGGERAMFLAQEGAEDHEEGGVRDINEIAVDNKDVVCGIAASLQTPYSRRCRDSGEEERRKNYLCYDQSTKKTLYAGIQRTG